MSTMNDFDRRAAAWLADGPTELSDRVLEAALREVHLTHRRRAARAPWRFDLMSSTMKAAAGIAIVAIVGVGGILFLNSSGGVGGEPTPGPTAPASPTAQPTVAPTLPAGVDTSQWTPFTSAVYGFPMAYPADWDIHARATRPWDPADGPDWNSPGMDTFGSPDGNIAVSVWGVPIDPGMDPSIGSSWGRFEGWIGTLCTQTRNEPCTGIHERVVPMCPDADTECHPAAMIVPFKDSVVGFKGGERGAVTTVVDGKEITYWIVVTVWQPDSFEGLDSYGGGTRLIQAFLESMGAQMPTRGPVDHNDHS